MTVSASFFIGSYHADKNYFKFQNSNFYRLLSEVSEGYVFTGICLFTGGGGCLHLKVGGLHLRGSAFQVGGGGLPSGEICRPPSIIRYLETPLNTYLGTHPGGSEPGNTVNAQAVRILLKSILVKITSYRC